MLYAVLAANTSRRAKVIVREDATKNGAGAWASLGEKFGRGLGATSFTEVFQHSWPSEKPFENVWRDWVKKMSNLPTDSLSSQATEQLTISGLSRHGQPKRENHLRLRPLAWQDIQTRVEKSLHSLVTTGTTTNGLTGAKCQSSGSHTHQRKDCWYKDAACMTCGKQRHLTKVCISGNPSGTGKRFRETSKQRQKKKQRIEHLKHACVVEKKAQDIRLQIQDCCMFKLRKCW